MHVDNIDPPDLAPGAPMAIVRIQFLFPKAVSFLALIGRRGTLMA
jgi:hypothetical protein